MNSVWIHWIGAKGAREVCETVRESFRLGFHCDQKSMMEDGETINLNPKERESVANLTGQVHQLPCCIKYDGPCSVSDYFKPKSTGMEIEGLKVEEAYFRGRKLQGATIPLPHGYSGFVIERRSLGKRKASDMSVEESKCWDVNAKFENITYWNHDSLPSENDAFLRAFHWFAVADALHKPVTAEDFASATLALEKLD